MKKLIQRVTDALEVLNPLNTNPTVDEKLKAYELIKEALAIIYE